MGWEHLASFVGGSVAAPIFGWLKSRGDNRHEEEMARIAKDAAAEAAKAGLRLSQETTRATEIEKRMEAFLAAIQAEKSITGTSRWVADVRALFRPGLTVVLVGIYVWALHIGSSVADTGLMVHGAVGFWFGLEAQGLVGSPRPTWSPSPGNVWGFPEKPTETVH